MAYHFCQQQLVHGPLHIVKLISFHDNLPRVDKTKNGFERRMRHFEGQIRFTLGNVAAENALKKRRCRSQDYLVATETLAGARRINDFDDNIGKLALRRKI